MEENLAVCWELLKGIITERDAQGKLCLKRNGFTHVGAENTMKYLDIIVTVVVKNGHDENTVNFFLNENILKWFCEWSCLQQDSDTIFQPLILCQLRVHELLLAHHSQALLQRTIYVQSILRLLEVSFNYAFGGSMHRIFLGDNVPSSTSMLTGGMVRRNSVDNIYADKVSVNKVPHTKSVDFALSSGASETTDLLPRVSFLLHQLVVGMVEDEEALTLLLNNGSSNSSTSTTKTSDRFALLSLLVPFLHDTTKAGQFAQDAVLLLVTLSAKHDDLTHKIVYCTDFCPVVAAGLSGAFSSLPRKLLIVSDDWFQIGDDDVAQSVSLKQFLDMFDFCNAIVQVGHKLLTEKLFHFIQHAFLLPVLAPALEQGSVEELTASIAYLDVIVRRATDPQMLKMLLKFLLTTCSDGASLLEQIAQRILEPSTRLSLVCITLLSTLVGLCCEDVMVHMFFRYLVPCTHVMTSQRNAIRDVDMYGKMTHKLMSLVPYCCSNVTATPLPSHTAVANTDLLAAASRCSLFQYMDYLRSAHASITRLEEACGAWSRNLYDGTMLCASGSGTSQVESLQSASDDVLLSSADGLVSESETGAADARSSAFEADFESLDELLRRSKGDGITVTPDSNVVDSGSANVHASGQDSRPEIDSSAVQSASSLGTKVSDSSGTVSLGSGASGVLGNSPSDDVNKHGSSGTDVSASRTQTVFFSKLLGTSQCNDCYSDIGPYLSVILLKLEHMPENSLYVNLQLTGLLAQLAAYPHPLLHSLLLNASLVLQPSVRSLIQVLSVVKKKIEIHASSVDKFGQLLDEAKQFFMYREQCFVTKKPWTEITTMGLGSPAADAPSPVTKASGSKRLSLGSVVKWHRKDNKKTSDKPGTIGGRSIGVDAELATKNVVYSALVMTEFLHELAAISQEQALFLLKRQSLGPASHAA